MHKPMRSIITRRREVSAGFAFRGRSPLLILLACAGFALTVFTVSAQPYQPEGLLAVSDFDPPGKIRIIDPARNTIVYDYYLSRDPGEPCNGEGGHCFPTGFSYANHNNNDYLDVMLTVSRPRAEQAIDQYYAVIQRVTATTPPTVVWKIKNLDFADVPDGEAYCKSSSDPCGAPVDPNCRIAFGEGMRVIDDRPQDKSVTLIAADGDRGRVMQLTLDYSEGSTCAHVDWVLGKNHPQWPVLELAGQTIPGWPNSVDHIDEGTNGGYLLVGFYASDMIPGKLSASGSRMSMWRRSGADWTLAWEFPDPNLGGEALLNTPHMAEVLTDPLTGARALWYSHSRGAADDWMVGTAGYGATFGILKLGESLAQAPTYVQDAGFFEETAGFELKFTRDQDYLADGSLLLMDAGCQNLCSNTGVVYHVQPTFLRPLPSTKAGYYSPSHEEQTLTEIGTEAIIDEYRCGFGALFEVEWIPGDQLGQSLKSAAQNARRPCPTEK